MILRACVDACRSKPIISGQLDLWLQPELRFAAGMLHVYVRTDLFAREEVESDRPGYLSKCGERCKISRLPTVTTLSGIGCNLSLLSLVLTVTLELDTLRRGAVYFGA